MSTSTPTGPQVKSGDDILKAFEQKIDATQGGTVSGGAIVDQFVKGIAGAVKELTPLQNVGYRLTLIILFLMGITIIGLGVAWSTQMPSVPVFPTVSADGANTAVLSATNTLQLQQYKGIAEVARAGPTEFFDQVVVRVLFPLLTALLGYLFGVRSASGEEK